MSLLAGTLAAILFAGCGSAHAGAWRQWSGNPVLRATLPWEKDSVGEPTVLWDRGRYRMWYTAGWDACWLGYAESKDGIHWRKRSRPLLSSACRDEVVKTSWGYLFFTSPGNGPAIQVSTSLDGIHLHRYQRPVLGPSGGWDSGPLQNSFAWESHHRWHLLYESMTRAGVFEIGLTSGAPNDFHNAALPLPFNTGGMAGGPWLDGHCIYYQASPSGLLPTSIFRRCTHDWRTWSGPQLMVGRSQGWEVDQVADPSIVRAPHRRPLLFFDGADNNRDFGAIGVARLR